MSTGYSGTPLLKKLGLKAGQNIAVLGAPEGYLRLLGPLPDDLSLAENKDAPLDVAHAFVTSRAVLQRQLNELRQRIAPNGMIWVSWPKRSSKAPTDVTEDVVRDIALPLGLVDVKVAAIDETWSGLKLVIRVENRPSGRR